MSRFLSAIVGVFIVLMLVLMAVPLAVIVVRSWVAR